MRDLSITFRQRFLQFYYLSTPIFAIMDIVWGINIWISFLDYFPFLKYAYYTIVFICGIYTYKYPQRADIVGILESNINIGILIVGFMSTYYNLASTILENMTLDNPFTAKAVINFSLSGFIFLISSYRNSWFLSRRQDNLRV